MGNTPVKKKGGVRVGAGRKPKATEEKIVRATHTAMLKEGFNIEGYFMLLINRARSDRPDALGWAKLFGEYAFGKPKDRIEITEKDAVNVKIDNWVKNIAIIPKDE